MLKKIFFITVLLFLLQKNYCRGHLHFIDKTAPIIFTEWQWNFPEEKIYFPTLTTKKYHYTNTTITEFPIFKTFDFEDIKNNYLPHGKILYRNSTTDGIESQELEKIVELFFKEVLQKKDTYTDVIILKNDDFKFTKDEI